MQNSNFRLGLLALHHNALDEAEAYFQSVLDADAHDIESLVNLGVVALKRELAQTAIQYFTQALLLNEHHLEARHNLAATFIHYDRFENALTHYRILLQTHPREAEYLYNAGVAEMALGHLAPARGYFETLLQQHPLHHDALTNLAAIHARLGQKQQAIDLLTKAQSSNPHDPSCQLMLAALTGDTRAAKTSPEYARNLFNNYALYYNRHLKETLQYTLPEHFARIMHQTIYSVAPIPHSLDLGCGTGLMGNVLRELSTQLTGVDIAEKMLKQAAQTGLYNQLITREGVDFLESCPTPFNLIVAADMLPYLGDLHPLFLAIRRGLTQGGYWLFSIEISAKEQYQLQPSTRFAHHPEYIRALQAQHQLHIIHQERVIARHQAEQEVPVMVYLMQAV
jgi:predicted TPR repeat methyltransferase